MKEEIILVSFKFFLLQMLIQLKYLYEKMLWWKIEPYD